MENSSKKLIVKTASGLDAVWESGGSTGKKGVATIVSDSEGKRKVPVKVNREPVPNGGIILFILRQGDYIISSSRINKQISHEIYRYEGNETLVPVNELGLHKEALHFANLKCNSFKCKSAFFFKKPGKNQT